MRNATCLGLVAGILGLFSTTFSAEPAATERGQKMLDDYLRRQTQRIADACLADIKTKEDWEKKRPELRRQILDMLGLWPLPPRTDLKPVVTGKVDAGAFTIEKLHFQSMPGLYVTGNLYVPKKAQFPVPAVLYVCGHSNTVVDNVSYGSKVSYQHHPGWLAEHGYVSLILDTLQYGEIEGIHHGTHPGQKRLWWWWHTLGYTPAGVECWNAMRALDYLETRPEVDPKRFGVTGRSGGGAYSWWLAAADDRPQCIIPVAGIADLYAQVVEGVAPQYRKGVISGHCDCMFMTNTYQWDFPLVAAMCAPRPLLLGNSDADPIFPVPGYRRLADKARKVYELYGAADKFALLETTGGHTDTPELRQGAFRWLNRWLKNDNGDIVEAKYQRRPPQELRVFDRLPADAINAKIQETFIPSAKLELPRTREEAQAWLKTKAPELKKALLEKVFHGWPASPNPAQLRPVEDQKGDGLHVHAFDFTSEDGIELRLWAVTIADAEPPNRVVLSVVDESGWQAWTRALGPDFQTLLQAERVERDAEAAERLRRRLTDGRLVQVVLAPRGLGPTRWAKEGSPDDSNVRRRFVLLGQTLDGQRVWDVRRAVQALRADPRMDGRTLALEGRGDLAGIALYAAVFEPGVNELDLWDVPASHRQGPILLNVCRHLDLPQASVLAFPRSIRLHGKDSAAAGAWAMQFQKLLGQNYLKTD
jgi:hypothetical protein